MRVRRAIPHRTDFAEVCNLFEDRGIIPSPVPADLVAVARKIHKCTYSLILWRFRLQDLPEHSSLFLDELASDALQILPQALMGYGKAASLLTRGVIENTLRHVYFSDHPVEFARLNRDKKWYVGNEALLEYARNHYDFVITEPKFDCLGQMSSLYSNISEAVHGRTIRHLELREALQDISFNQGAAEIHADYVIKTTHAVNFLLAIYHRESMRAFALQDRRFLLRSMPPEARQVWSEHDRELMA